MARRFPRSVVTRQRRATQWLQSAIDTGSTSLAAGAAVLDQSFAFGEKATIVRTRGRLWVKSDQIASTEEPFGAIGLAVVTDQAFAIGVTAVPTPITDASSDNWFLWEPWQASMVAATQVGFSGDSWTGYELDSKAMRKVDDGDTVVVVLENTSGAHGCEFIVTFRMLVKLHA